MPCAPTWYLLAGAFEMSWLIDWLIDAWKHSDGDDSTERLTATFAALHVFCKLDPELLVKHSIALHPFMHRKFSVISSYHVIPEQFTVIGPPSFIWRGGGGGGEGQKKLWWHTFQRLRPEEFSSGDYAGGFRPEEFFLAGDLLWRSTLRIRIRILIYRFSKYWGSLISDENSSGRSPLESVPVKVKVKVFFKNHFRPKAS